MKRYLIYSAVVVAVTALAAFAFYNWTAGRSATIDANDPAQVALGKRVYAEKCASCHGATLKGEPNWQTRKPTGRLPAPPHDESGHTWHHPDNQLFILVKKGPAGLIPGYQSDMPAFENQLSDDEIRASLAFIKSQWPAEIRARQESMNDSD